MTFQYELGKMVAFRTDVAEHRAQETIPRPWQVYARGWMESAIGSEEWYGLIASNPKAFEWSSVDRLEPWPGVPR